MLETGVSGEIDAQWDFLTYLRDPGRQAAAQCPDQHVDDIGERSRFTLDVVFGEGLRPVQASDSPTPREGQSQRQVPRVLPKGVGFASQGSMV